MLAEKKKGKDEINIIGSQIEIKSRERYEGKSKNKLYKQKPKI